VQEKRGNVEGVVSRCSSTMQYGIIGTGTWAHANFLSPALFSPLPPDSPDCAPSTSNVPLHDSPNLWPSPGSGSGSSSSSSSSTQPRPWGCQTQAESSSVRDSLEMKRVPRVAYPTRFRTLTHGLGTYDSCTRVRANGRALTLSL